MQRDYMIAWLALRQPGSGASKEELQSSWDSCKRHLQPNSAASSNPRWRKRWEDLAETLLILRSAASEAAGSSSGHPGVAALPGPVLCSLQSPPTLTVRSLGGWTLEVVAEALEVTRYRFSLVLSQPNPIFSSQFCLYPPLSLCSLCSEHVCLYACIYACVYVYMYVCIYI
jgi:hypothetical protein